MRNSLLAGHPSTGRLRFPWLVAACGVQLAFLLWAARQAAQQAIQCDVCDSSYYYIVAAEFARSGLLFTNPYDGYRSYFAPFFIAAIQWLATGFDAGMVERYTYGVTILFWVVSVGLMAWLARRASAVNFLTTTLPTLLNPFLLVYVPFALQEGVVIACCLPLLFIWLGAKDWARGRRAVLVVLMALLAYTIRASLVWWLAPAMAYAAWTLWPRLAQPRPSLLPVATIVIAAGLLVGPQTYISYHRSGSLNPYPSTALLSQQIAWGVTMYKLATVEDEGHWRGLVYWSPFAAEPDEDKTFRFYLEHPMGGAFLMASHAYVGFHYDQIKPYWHLDRARPITIWLVLSSAVVFLGVVRMSAKLVTGKVDADGAFMIATFALCAASLLLLAAESRFGVIGFAMLSIQVSQWLASRPSRADISVLAPAVVLYVAVSFLYNAMLLQSADISF
jgi:hypothetical protein